MNEGRAAFVRSAGKSTRQAARPTMQDASVDTNNEGFTTRLALTFTTSLPRTFFTAELRPSCNDATFRLSGPVNWHRAIIWRGCNLQGVWEVQATVQTSVCFMFFVNRNVGVRALCLCVCGACVVCVWGVCVCVCVCT